MTKRQEPLEKVVLITGAAQRIGAHTARHLHQKGWRVLLHYRSSATAAQALAQELNQLRPHSCHLLQADLSQDHDINRLAQEAESVWQRLDALVNNASAFYPTPIGQASSAQWDDLFSSNAKAPFFLAQAFAPLLKKNHGCIINMLDIHAEHPLKSHTLYCMAKAAAAMMTLSLAKELAPAIRVNGIAPGAILWPSTHTPDEPAQARILAEIPMGQLGSPQDITRTIAFLLDDAPYITGQIVNVDGGRRL